MNTDAYKAKLTEELVRLETELKSVGRRNPSNPNDWEAVPQTDEQEADPNDVATNIEGYEDNTAILKELEIRYNQVRDALARIDARTYGKCSVCGNEIEAERLAADPAATTCLQHVG